MSKIQETIDVLKVKYPAVRYHALEMDLSNQQDVRRAAAELLSWDDVPTVDILINSAGIMNIPKRTFSTEGIEIQFATNHIGHFLFTNLIMPKIMKAAEANPVKGATRIVNVSSGSPGAATMRWSDPNFEKKSKELPESEQPSYDMLRWWGYENPEELSYIPLEGYNQSKVANVLFGIALTKRLYEQHGILSLTVHPGVIRTELSRSADPKTIEAIQGLFKKGVFTYKTQGAGAATSLVAALDPELGVPISRSGMKENYGAFLENCQICDSAKPLAVSSTEAEKLWKVSEELVGQIFEW